MAQMPLERGLCCRAMLRLLLLSVVLVGCGRTLLTDEPGAADARTRDAGTTVDAGREPPLCPPPQPGVGRVWGTTPLGTIDFQNVWVGTEGPWSHSCPHLTLFASPGDEPNHAASFSVDFLYAKPLSLGPKRGVATLQLGGKTAAIPVTADVTRADGLTTSGAPMEGWRTTLTFAAADAGWTVQGFVTEAPDCMRITWFCL